MIIAPGCPCGFRCVARYPCECVSALIFEKVCFCSSPRVCCCLWVNVEQLEASPRPPSCDSSSIWVRWAGWAAALLVIASEMNYLAESETQGGEEIVIELPPSLPPSPLCLKLLHLQCRKLFSARTLTHIHTKNTHTLTKPMFPLPHAEASAEGHIDAGWFHRLIVHGRMHTGPHFAPALLFIAQRQTLSCTLCLCVYLLLLHCIQAFPIWGAL